MPKRLLIIAALLIVFSAAFCVRTQAAETDKPYDVIIRDFADLLADEDEDELYYTMLEGADYANMVFMTIDDAEGYSSRDYIEMVYQTDDSLKGTNAVIYLIDMDNRLLWISGYGEVSRQVTADYGNLITDNVYKYAKNGDFAACAVRGYKQIVQRLEGNRVSGSLRGVGNLCIAVILAEILCFVIAYVSSAVGKTKTDEILSNIDQSVNIQEPVVRKTGSRRVYAPPKSSGGSGGGGYRSSGGGFHGGGGGHGF